MLRLPDLFSSPVSLTSFPYVTRSLAVPNSSHLMHVLCRHLISCRHLMQFISCMGHDSFMCCAMKPRICPWLVEHIAVGVCLFVGEGRRKRGRERKRPAGTVVRDAYTGRGSQKKAHTCVFVFNVKVCMCKCFKSMCIFMMCVCMYS